MHKNAFLLLKNCKNRPALGASPQTSNGLRRLGAISRERFLTGRAENIIYKFRFVPKFAKHLPQPIILMRVGSCTSSSHLTTGVWRHYQNNPFLGMFQLKFCLKTFQTCSLLYISVFNVAFYQLFCSCSLLPAPMAEGVAFGPKPPAAGGGQTPLRIPGCAI